MSNKQLPLNSIILLYRITTIIYILMAIIFITLIKTETYADWSFGEMTSNNYEGFRMSVWMWYIGILISFLAFRIDMTNLKLGKYPVMNLFVIIYLIFHILVALFIKLGNDVSIEISWIKWVQIGVIPFFIYLYSRFVNIKGIIDNK